MRWLGPRATRRLHAHGWENFTATSHCWQLKDSGSYRTIETALSPVFDGLRLVIRTTYPLTPPSTVFSCHGSLGTEMDTVLDESHENFHHTPVTYRALSSYNYSSTHPTTSPISECPHFDVDVSTSFISIPRNTPVGPPRRAKFTVDILSHIRAENHRRSVFLGSVTHTQCILTAVHLCEHPLS